MAEISERRHVREHEDDLRAARERAVTNAVIYGFATGLAVMLLLISVGGYSVWPLVVWGVMTSGMAVGLVFSIFEYAASWPPREIVEVVEMQAIIEDEPAVAMMVSIGPNSLGLSRKLKPMQWRALADALYASGLNWNRAVLQGTGNWPKLTVGKTYPDLVKEWQVLGIVKGNWAGEGDSVRLKSVDLLPFGWNEIQKIAGTHYVYEDTPPPLVGTSPV